MIRFNSDYTEGAHPAILQRLMETNMEQTPGYGEDEHCKHAARLIREQCADDSVAVHFLVGGTQTNLTVISAALRPHQSVLSADAGHIYTHEAGAIEATGHKVEPIFSADGKITAQQIEERYLNHIHDEAFEHITQPKMVYISFPTEIGTIYSRKELGEIHEVCKKYDLYLFIDGARLGYGLASPDNDLDIPFITQCADVFYIGGTKVGALFGEAVVIVNEFLKKDFRYLMKQKGAMLAKGRLLGIQFETLFTDNLYFEISQHAIHLAMMIKNGLEELDVPFLIDSPTNQQFPIFSNEILQKIARNYAYTTIQRIDETLTAIRLCTSWATQREQVTQLLTDIRSALAFPNEQA